MRPTITTVVQDQGTFYVLHDPRPHGQDIWYHGAPEAAQAMIDLCARIAIEHTLRGMTGLTGALRDQVVETTLPAWLEATGLELESNNSYHPTTGEKVENN